MNDDAKRLTLFLGECWHDSVYTDHRGNICLKCDRATFLGNQRSFFLPDDWADLGAVRNKLVETGKWEKFENQSYIAYEKEGKVRFNDLMLNPAAFTAWFIYPPTFNRLAAEFLKGEKG